MEKPRSSLFDNLEMDVGFDISSILCQISNGFVDENTLHNSPSPVAVSTVVKKPKAIPERPVSSLKEVINEIEENEHDATEDSSFGILSLTKIESDLSFNDDPKSVLKNVIELASAANLAKSRKEERAPKLESIMEESDNEDVDSRSLSLRYLAPMKTSVADLTDYLKEIPLDVIKRKLQLDKTEAFPQRKESNSFSQEIDFRDDQFSARSSSLGSSQRSFPTIEQTSLQTGINLSQNNKSAYSDIFRRYTFDTSNIISGNEFKVSQCGPDEIPTKQNKEGSLKKSSGVSVKESSAVFKMDSLFNELQNVGSKAKEKTPSNQLNLDSERKERTGNLEMHYNLAEQFSKDMPNLFDNFATGFDDEEFVAGENFQEFLDADEEEFKEKNRFLQGEDATTGGDSLGSSWVLNVSHQDMTRPSWLSVADTEFSDTLPTSNPERKDRISIGRFMRMRSEDMGSLGSNLKGKRPTFGSTSNLKLSPPNPNMETIRECELSKSVQPTVKSVLNGSVSDTFIGNLNVPDISTINNMMKDASINEDETAMALKAMSLWNLPKQHNKIKIENIPVDEAVSLNTKSESTILNVVTPNNTVTVHEDRNSDSKELLIPRLNISEEQNSRPNISQSMSYPGATSNLIEKEISTLEEVMNKRPNKVLTPQFTNRRSIFTKNKIVEKSSKFKVPIESDLKPKSSSFKYGLNSVAPLKVMVDSAVSGPAVCCLGTLHKLSFAIDNQSSSWIDCRNTLLTIYIDGFDVVEKCCRAFVFPASVTIEPGTRQSVSVDFVALQPGKWNMKFCCTSLSSEMSNPLAFVLDFLTEVEVPDIRIESPLGSNVLDFGVVPYSCTGSIKLHIYNKGKSKVPLRICIEDNMRAGCKSKYFFPRKNEESKSCLVKSPNVMQCEIDPGSFAVCVAFNSEMQGSLYNSEEEPHVLKSVICAEVDSPGYPRNVDSLIMVAVVGSIILETDKKAISLVSSNLETESTSTLCLSNLGKIAFPIQFTFKADSEAFSVYPRNILLQPGSRNINVSFHPSDLRTCLVQSSLLMTVQPDGPEYEIPVEGCSLRNQGVLLSCRKTIIWEDAKIGARNLNEVMFTNGSMQNSLSLIASLKGDTDNFKVHDEDKINSLMPFVKFSLEPQQNKTLQVAFQPTGICVKVAQLIVKSTQPIDQNFPEKSVKYMVNLVGISGKSNIMVDSLTSDHNLKITKNKFDASAVSQFCMTNAGNRACFVQLVPVTARGSCTYGVFVEPSSFILCPQKRKVVKINVSEGYTSLTLVAYHGEEVLRRRLLRSLEHNTRTESDYSVLEAFCHYKYNCTYDEEFAFNEDLGEIASGPVESSLFFSALQRFEIGVEIVKEQENLLKNSTFPIGLVAFTPKSNGVEIERPTFTSPPCRDVAQNMPPDLTCVSFQGNCTLKPYKLLLGEVCLSASEYRFPETIPGGTSMIKISLKNPSTIAQNITVIEPKLPFNIKHLNLNIKSRHYVNLRVYFNPGEIGEYQSQLVLELNDRNSISLALIGKCKYE